MKGDYSDDYWFRHAIDEVSPFAFVKERYLTVGPRIVPEFFCSIVAQSFFIFCCINIFLWLSLAWSINTLLCIDDIKMKFMTVLMVLLYPFQDMAAAGWMASSTNYLWTTASVLFYAVFLRRYIDGIKQPYYFYILVFFAVFYGSFQEQSCVMIIFVTVAFMMYSWWNKKHISRLLFIFSLICISDFCIVMSAPGNPLRMAMEIQSWNIDFPSLTVADKAVLGLIRAEKVFIAQPNNTFLLFSLILSICTITLFKSKKINGVLLLVSQLPLFVIFVYRFVCAYIPTLKAIFSMPEDYLIVDYHNLMIYPPLLILLVVVVSVSYSLFLIMNTKQWVLYMLVLIGAFSTQLAMGFSPTIYASTRRTSIFLFYTLIVVTLRLAKMLYDNEETKKIIKPSVCILSMFAALFCIQNEIYIVLTGI